MLGLRELDFTLDRFPPAPDLAGLVERHWLVSWELPPRREASITLLPQPCVNLVLDQGRLAVCGVGRDRFTYAYRGTGRVFGVKFRPGAFLPFLGRPLAEITDAVLPAERLWGPAATALASRLTAARGRRRAGRAGRGVPAGAVAARRPAGGAGRADRGGDAARPSISRVDDVTERFGLTARTLQRLFQRYVGVSPKWVLRRYRLHEAAAALAREQHRPWAEVAADLGYFDQSHFIRDFTAAIGLTPVAYAQACRANQAPVSA